MSRRPLIAVVPAAERARRTRLFDALELAFDVAFEGREPGELAGADAAFLIAAGALAEREADRAGLRRVVALGYESDPGAGAAANGHVRAATIELGRTAALDRRLHGQSIQDDHLSDAAPVPPGGEVLATRGADPVWTAAVEGERRCDTVAVAPAELAEGEALRARIEDGRALALLPLVQLARELTAGTAFTPPPLRATFLMDDPNLHWPSYGYLRYREIVRHADEHGYHAAMAMVPLDGWLAHPGAVHLFRTRADRLSLCIHGNNHVLEELLRPRPQEARRATLAQALRRADAFERRTGVRVARVMTPPHGGCNEAMASDMLRLGYDALCVARPYPWSAMPPLSWLTGPEDASPLAAFGPATLVTGGLPVILRRPFDASPSDLALRAFLDQPLVLYGHHDDVEGGLDLFAEWARRVNDLGDVRWTSLDEIARTNCATLLEGDLLRVRMYGRRASLRLPAGARRVAVELPPGSGGDGRERVLCGAAGGGAPGQELPLVGHDGHTDVSLVREDALEPGAIRAPSWRPWPVARRLAGEGRDRVVPVYRRVAARRS